MKLNISLLICRLLHALLLIAVHQDVTFRHAQKQL